MIHFPNASFHLAAVMGAIWLPVVASAAPDRTAVISTQEYVLAVELLEARTIRIRVRARGVSLCFLVSLARLILGPAPCNVWGQWYQAGIRINDYKCSKIGRDHEGKEEEV